LSSGVVQGSCIGPLLFLIYVNDVSDAFSDSCVCKLYADDIKIYTVIRTVDDCQNLQKCLDMLHNWSRTWQLSVSYKKCSFLVAGSLKDEEGLFLHLRGNIISRQGTVKDLGIHIDNSLKFSSHINQIVAKAHARASLIHNKI